MTSVGEIAAGTAVELFFAFIAIAVIYRLLGWFSPIPKRHLVQAFQTGVVLRQNKVHKVVGPGAYWIIPGRLVLCDMRPTPFQVPSQQFLTSDGLAVRIGPVGEYRVVDPALFIAESSDAFARFYFELRQVLHLTLSETNRNVLFTGQDEVMARIKELLVPREAQLGIQTTHLNVCEAIPIA